MMELSTSSATEPNEGKTDEQTSAPATKRIKIETLADIEDKISNKKPKDSEICVPIVYGSAAFWLGKKASEYLSHKWTVYVRGAKNEDLSVVIKRVVFQLHHSFKNPYRVVESPPFELSESGWGEFEIAITIFFHDDVCDRKLDLAHLLKLYPPEDGPLSTKKPVVTETYDEIVFPNPSESFYSRVCIHPAVILSRFPPPLDLLPVSNDDENPKKRGDTKNHSLSQWFTEFSDADELLHLTAAREQVQSYIAKLKKQLGATAAPPQPSENSL